MNEEQIIDKVSMIDQWKVSGDSYTQGELDAIGQLLELYYDNKKQLEQEKEKNKELEATNKAFHHFIMFTGGKDIKDISATEYMRIRQEGYIDGRCYEQQKAEEIITNNYIRKDKIKELLENEIIDISGFRCIAVEDIQNLLEV